MLTALRIENFALIDCLELSFGAGLNVLTGETGAGKSIILDAIDTVLGGKVSSRVIRTGTDKALIEATFQVEPNLANWLNQQEIDLIDEQFVICSRELAVHQGNLRSRSRINGVLVNRPLIDRLRDRLVEITAQGQTVQIGQPTLQRELLDLFGGNPIIQQRSTVTAAFLAYQQAVSALEKRRHSEQQRLQRLDLLEYQIRELQATSLTEADELEQLEQERQRLSHVVELQQLSYKVYQALYQNDRGELAAADLLGQAETTLNDMVRYDSQLQTILEMVSTALAQISEAGRQINSYGEGLETDPHRLEEVEERLRSLKQICRKYGPTLADAIAHYQKLQSELAELTGTGESLEELEKTAIACQETLTLACQQLTQLRITTAKELDQILVQELKPLAMEKVQFQVKLAPAAPSSTGADIIAFYFSPNPGEPLQPIAAIASGGEMSRFLLALKACFSQVDSASTLVFDEIDVGVSGRVAQAIAAKLYQLSHRHQVLCVTHQPLVAAMADHHFRVDKETINSHLNPENNLESIHPAERTVVRATILDNSQRREELAQLAGGQSAQEAIAFAESLLAQAERWRQNQPPALADSPQ